MKRNCPRTYVALIASILIATIVIGCGSGTDIAEEASEYVFVPEFTSLSGLAGDLPNMRNIIVTENSIYFTSTSNMDSNSLFQTTHIFCIDLDELVLGYLFNYTAAPPPPDAEGGGVIINAMQVDNDGNLWVAETVRYVTFDFPPYLDLSNATVDALWEHHRPFDVTYAIRKLDITGMELQSIDITALASSARDWFGINAFYIDDEQNIFIGSGQTVYVLDIDANILFYLDAEGFIFQDSFIRLSDGQVAFSEWSNRLSARTLRQIDIQSRAWGANIELPPNTQNIFHGIGEYLVIVNDGTSLLGIQNETGDVIQILNWIAAGVEPVGLGNITFLPEDRIMFTTELLGHGSTGQLIPISELVTLNKTPQNEILEKTVITVATSWAHIISPAVAEFNRTSSSYRIEIRELELDFSTLLGDIDRLALDIIAGHGPDIIHTPSFPFHQWAGRGLFVDLYEFIDADPTLDRSDFVESVLRNAEINGRLYQIFPDFSVSTIIGHPDTVGSVPGWSINEFMAVLDANPQATLPLGLRSGSLFHILFMHNSERFINWDSGTVYFDSEYFVELLELVYAFNKMVDWGEMNWDSPEAFRLISSGIQIAEIIDFSMFTQYTIYQDLFGGDFVFKGFPAESGSGNSLSTTSGMAMLATSENQQGAWEFIRMFLSEGWQSVHFQIPSNRSVFEEKLTEAMEEADNPLAFYQDLTTEIRPLTDENIDNIRALIDSASGVTSQIDPLWDIVIESLAGFFQGTITAQDAARVIQSRAAMFVAEQS